MQKILFLDWDGPVSNSRTWHMPGFVDPVAVKLLNDATKAGWQVCLSSTIRKDFQNVDEAMQFMEASGLHLNFAEAWRTDSDYTNRRHLEIANHLMKTEYEEDVVFLVVDDELIPVEMLECGRMMQLKASSHAGLDYLSISKAYQIFKMNDVALNKEFSNGNRV